MQRRVLPLLFATLMIDMIGGGMVIPIIPVIFTDPSSASFLLEGYSTAEQYLLSGLIFALFGIIQFFVSPILGELSDAYGRKKLLILGVALLAVSQFFFGLGIIIASVPLLLFSRAFAGIGGANFSIVQAAIADVTAPEDRGKNFGLIGAAFGAGFILGPLLGGSLAAYFGNPAAPFWVSSAFGLINMTSVYFLLPETNKARRASRFTLLKGIHNLRAAFTDADARVVYLSNFLYMCGFAFLTAFTGILLVERFSLSEASIGTFFAVVGVWIVITQLVFIRLVSRWFRDHAILRVTLASVAIALALYPFMPSVFWLYVLVPFFTVAHGLSMPTMTALVSKSVPETRQGAALGINGSLLAFSQGVIPLLAGGASSVLGIAAPFMVGALFVTASWLNLFVFSRK